MAEKTIESYEKLFWRISGMRCTREYEILNRGKEAEISEYEMRCISDGWERVLIRRVVCPNKRIRELFHSFGIAKWDGFNGKHPRGVRDGEMFSFKASVNDGKTIRAEGSENFPKGFREFRAEINRLLSEKAE